MNLKQVLFLISCWSLVSCQLFSVNEEVEVLAKVNAHRLLKSELNNIALLKGLSSQDSAVFVKAYIERWATDKILLDRAQLNLPKSKQAYFDSLAKDYRDELLKKAYLDAVVEKQAKQQIDSFEVVKYFEQNKLNFKLNENLVKVRYIVLEKSIQGFETIKKAFKRFTAEDHLALSNQSLEYKSLFLNDSTWLRTVDLKAQLDPFIESLDLELFSQKGFVERNNKDTFVLLYVNDVRSRGDQAPLSYIKPTITQILVNKKKLEVSKDIQKELKNDAIQNNEFKIYE